MATNGTALKQPRNLLELSTQEKREFLDTIDQVISDVDGVVWNLTQKIDGAVDGFDALTGAGKKLTFMSNNCVRTPEMYAEAFKKIKLNVEMKDILNPTIMMVQYLKSIKFDGLIYVLGCDAVKKALIDAGFNVKIEPLQIYPEDLRFFLKKIFDSEPVRAVIVEIDFNLSLMKLLKAETYLRHPDCKLIVGATDNELSVTKDINVMGPGPFGRMLSESAKKPMIVLGKPGKELGDMVRKYCGIRDPTRVLMIGDMLEQDIRFGKRNNFRTVAVLSGGCELKDIRAQTDPELIPDYYCQSMRDFVQFVNDVNKSKV